MTSTAAQPIKPLGASVPVRSQLLARLSATAAIWGLGYAAYRAYYAAGGTLAIPGIPAPAAHWRLINLIGALIIAAGAALPLAMLPLWTRRRARPVLLAICWLVAVFCCMHALVMMTERVLSLTGLLHLDYPDWTSIDRRAADLQDLFGNEPWFLLEGLAYAALAWVALDPGRRRRRWVAGAIAAVAALTALGLLSATGVIGKTIIA